MRERVRSTSNVANFFGLITVTFLFTVLADWNTILSFEAERVFAGVWVGFAGRFDNGNGLCVLAGLVVMVFMFMVLMLVVVVVIMIMLIIAFITRQQISGSYSHQDSKYQHRFFEIELGSEVKIAQHSPC